MKNRLTSWVFWSSIAAQIVSLLVVTGVLSVTESEAVNTVIAGVLQLFVTFGVLNNPTDSKNF